MAAGAAEAQRILDTLNNLTVNVGEAYVELSGQTAATQAVVADLRRCAAFLNTRLAGEQPPPPWLASHTHGGASSSSSTPAGTPTPGRRSPFGQDMGGSSAPASASGTPLGGPPPSFRSPSPSHGPSTPLAPTASGPMGRHAELAAGVAGGSAPSTPLDTGLPGRGSAVGAPYNRPPLGAAGGSGAAGRGAGVGGGRGAGPGGRAGASAAVAAAGVASRNNTPSMPAAGRPSFSTKSRDATPQRRPGVRAGATSSPATATLRSASPGAASTPRPAAMAPLGSPATTPGGAVTATATDNSAPASSHLPLAAQRAMAAMAAMATSSGCGQGGDVGQAQQEAGPAKPAGPPQLPLALRRGMQQYRETLATREQLLQQHQQRRGGSRAVVGSLADCVAAAGRSYCATLGRQYPSTAGGGATVSVSTSLAAAQQQLQRVSLGPQQKQRASVVAMRRDAQVKFSALVAAQTWLIQSLTDLSRSRGAGGGVAGANRRAAQADACAALLTEVEQLRSELAGLQQQLAAAEQQQLAEEEEAEQQQAVAARNRPRSSRPESCGAAAGGGPGAAAVAATAAAVNAMVEALGIDYELAEAAALWRNRFMRAMLAAVGSAAAAVASQGGGGGGGGAAARVAGARGGAGGNHTGARILAAASPAAPAAATGRSALPCAAMPRPLGVWLPDAMWVHAPAGVNAARPPEVSVASLSSSSSTAAAAAAVVSFAHPETAPPWSVLLPPHPHGAQSSATPAAAQAARRTAPPPLLCGSAQDAVAYGRAQQLLQTTVFQMCLESSLAAPLLPRPQPPQPPPQLGNPTSGRRGAGQQAAAAAGLAWERWLAQCRLAHMLLFKGAWNRLCSVVELEEEFRPEAGGGY